VLTKEQLAIAVEEMRKRIEAHRERKKKEFAIQRKIRYNAPRAESLEHQEWASQSNEREGNDQNLSPMNLRTADAASVDTNSFKNDSFASPSPTYATHLDMDSLSSLSQPPHQHRSDASVTFENDSVSAISETNKTDQQRGYNRFKTPSYNLQLS
jgi:hypothetical protein